MEIMYMKMMLNLVNIMNCINNYHDVYCFFDRMSLGQTLTVYCGLEYKEQDKIFNDCKKAEIDFGVDKTPDFISKFFTLIAVRNCVMHCNSLEILIRFIIQKRRLFVIVQIRKDLQLWLNIWVKKKTIPIWYSLSSDPWSIYICILNSILRIVNKNMAAYSIKFYGSLPL